MPKIMLKDFCTTTYMKMKDHEFSFSANRSVKSEI
jgi:hypothetical protein